MHGMLNLSFKKHIVFIDLEFELFVVLKKKSDNVFTFSLCFYFVRYTIYLLIRLSKKKTSMLKKIHNISKCIQFKDSGKL